MTWIIAVLAIQLLPLQDVSFERRPYVHHYTQDDHPGDIGTRDVVQDGRGFIYVANPWGVMEFDGVRWEMLPPVQPSALAVDASGRVWVGGDGDLGYLEAVPMGTTRYHSLMDRLPEGVSPPDAVYRVVATEVGVFFLTNLGLFRWADGGFTLWPPDPDIESYFLGYTGSEILLQRSGGVVYALDGDSFRVYEPLASIREKLIDAARDAETGDLIVALRSGALLRSSDSGLERIRTPLEPFLQRYLIEDITVLQDGLIAVATRFDGAVVLREDGSPIADLRIGSYPEIQSATHRMTEDRDGGLWLATDMGPIRVAIDEPLNFLLEPPAKIMDVTMFDSSLVVGTTQGIYFPMEPDRNVSGPPVQPEYFLDTEGQLLFRNLGDLMRLKGGRIEHVGRETTCIASSIRYPGSIYLCPDEGGIERIRYDGASDTWRTEFRWQGGPDRLEVDYLAEEMGGTLWLNRVGEYIVRAEPAESDQVAGLRVFKRHTDLPMYIVDAISWSGHIYFRSDAGILKYEAEADPPFVQDQLLKFMQEEDESPASLFPLDQNRMLVGYRPGVVLLERTEDEARADSTNTRISSILPQTEQLHVLHAVETDRGTILFGAIENRLVRYDLFRVSNVWEQDKPDAPIIRSLAVDEASKSVTAVFAAPIYPVRSTGTGLAPFFQYRIPQLSPAWSEWSHDGSLALPRLPPHDYLLELRVAQDPLIPSETVHMAFSVPPAWYQQTGVRIVGAILFLGMMVLGAVTLASIRTRQLRQRSRDLEDLVAIRTRRIEAQKEELAEQAERLLNLNRTKSRFFEDISHELRTPLTLAVGPLADLISGKHGQLGPEIHSHVEQAYRSVSQMSQHVSQMLDLSRLEAGVVVLDLTDGDLANCIERVAMQFESQAVRFNIDLQIDIDRARQRVAFDADKVQKITANLLSNAIKFTQDGGEVTLRAEVDDNLLIRLEVSDNGIGMSPEKVNTVFDRYFRVGQPVPGRDIPEGEGIGLSIVRELVLLHKGEISLRSEPGSGSTFEVFIQGYPVSSLDAVDVGRTDDEQTVRSFVRDDEPLILVVEDNAAIRDYLRDSLEELGRVITANDGVEGIETSLENVPDVIVADVMMPRMDGYEFCRVVREDIRLSHIPIVLLTARVEEEARIEGMAVGADAHIGKPFNPRELRARVNMLRERQLRLRESLRAGALSHGEFPASVPDFERGFVESLRRILEREIANASFTMEQFAEELNMSRSQLYRKTGALLDESPSAMLRELRLQRGHQLLADGSASVKEVAAAVGFGSDSSFRSAFRERFGYPPSEATGRVG